MTNNKGFKILRIGFVSNSAWSVYNFRLDVIRHLLQQGHEIIVMAADDEYSQLLRDCGCRFISINFNNRTENPFRDYFFFRQLKKIYKEYKPDILFHYVIKPNIYGSLAAASCNIPSVAVITGLGYAFAKHNFLYWIIKRLYKISLRKSKEVWFLNNNDAKVFLKAKVVNIEKIKILPGEGINTDFFSKDFNGQKTENRRFRFLMSTRLLKSKGVGIYADAARILKKKYDNIDFELIGFFEKHHPDSVSPEDLKKWEKQGLIHYGGFAKDVRPFLLNTDCFVFPSFYNEGVPRCLMEAASMELPVITSLNTGCKEVVINNTTGYFCNMNDPFDLADKMEKIISLSVEERATMGRNGRSLVTDKFNIQKVINEYEQTLQKIDIGD